MGDFVLSDFYPKKKLFGVVFESKANERLSNRQLKKFGIKFYETDDTFNATHNFTLNNNGVETKKCKLLSRYSETQAMAFTKDNHFFNINLNTGNISPEYIGYSDSLYLAADGKIYKMDENGNSVDTGYSSSENTFRGYRLVLDNNDGLKVVDKNGKFGRIDHDLNVVCPFMFDNNNFYCLVIDKKQNLRKVVDYKNDKIYILGNNGQPIYENTFNDNNEFKNIGENVFLYRDKEKNVSTLFEYDSQNNSLNQIGKFNSDIKNCQRVGKEIYLNVNDTSVIRLSDNKTIVDNCKLVDFREIDKEPIIYYTATGYHNKLETVGIYSLKEDREILSPDKMITKVLCRKSVKMPDGSYRLLSQATYQRGNYNPPSNSWGVIDDQGNELLEFKYDYDPYKEKTFIRKEKGREIVETVFSKGFTNYYFNIREKNMIANNDEVKKIRLPKEKDKRYDWDNFQSTLKSDRECEKVAASVAASFLLESPIAGLIVYSAMDEMDREM